MDKTQGLKVTRRSILNTIPALSAISAGSSFFTKAACAQEPLEDGYTICDNCNQMPMCGIHFQRQGNTVVSVGNWKEHSGKLLCNKALATLLQPQPPALSDEAHQSERKCRSRIRSYFLAGSSGNDCRQYEEDSRSIRRRKTLYLLR